MALKLGVNKNVSNSEYHSEREFLSSSVLKTILKDPAEYERQYLKGGQRPPIGNQAALDLGSLAHSRILEPHLVQQDYNFYPGNIKRGKEYDAWLKSAKPGKPIISAPQLEVSNKLMAAYKSRSAATDLLVNAETEYTLCVELEGVPIKVRYDAVQAKKGKISDVKTTGYSGELESFRQTVRDLDYGLSGALYTMAAQAHFGSDFDFFFIVLSKVDFTCNVYRLGPKSAAEGRAKVLKALDLYKKCKASGLWLSEEENGPNEEPESDAYEIKDV